MKNVFTETKTMLYILQTTETDIMKILRVSQLIRIILRYIGMMLKTEEVAANAEAEFEYKIYML